MKSEPKLVIQIPCYNEENTLPITLAELPSEIPGIDSIEILIVNDGSTDRTLEAAEEYGVNHIVSFSSKKGLAQAFQRGIDTSLKMGADIIVNLDADNQYNIKYLPDLIQPVLEKRCDMAIGVRPIKATSDFSPLKKFLQLLGSKIISALSGVQIKDATSGFRCFSREAALSMDIESNFTYTLESIIQLSHNRMKIETVTVDVNPKLRKSRLFRSNLDYIIRSFITLTKLYIANHAPLLIFLLALILGAGSLVFVSRFVWLRYLTEGVDKGFVSLTIGAILGVGAFLSALFAFLAEVLQANRRMLQRLNRRLRQLEFEGSNKRNDQ